MCIEEFNHLGKVRKGSGQPVDLVDHHDPNALGGNILEQASKGRALGVAARESPIVVTGLYYLPALLLLAQDERFTGLPLCIKGVEPLLQSLLRGLAGVDCAGNY